MKSIIKLSGLFALTLALFSCSDQQQKTDAPETKIAGTTVQLSDEQFKNAGIRTDTTIRKPISTLLRLNGRIDVPPQNMISVSIPLGGYLKSTSMLPGKHVSKGEILGVMEDPEYIQLQQDYLVTNAKLVYSSQVVLLKL